MNSLIYTSVFGELTKVVQARIDAASAAKRQLFSNTYYEEKMTWDTPTIGLNFEDLIGQYGLDVAAATLGENGKEPIRGFEGLTSVAGKSFKHAHTFPLTIQDYRKILQLLDSRVLSDDVRRAELINILWGTVANAVNGVRAKVDMLFLQAISNDGVLTLNSTNNPEGGLVKTINYNMPAENKADAKKDWTAANLATADPLEDILAMQDKYADVSPISEIWLSQARLSYILRLGKFKEAVFGTDFKNSPLVLNAVNEFMRMNELPIFRVIRRKVNIQGKNGKLTPFTPFNDKRVVFVPEGSLGVIKNAFADSELRPEAGVAYANDGRIRISQWGVGETQNSNGVEFTKAEVTALPLFTAINGIYSLKVE